MHYYSSLTALLANTDPTDITAYDVVHTLEGHAALDEIIQHPLSNYDVEIVRADGEALTCHLDTETSPLGIWRTSFEGQGESGEPEQSIRALHAAVQKWLDGCDMSDSQLDTLAGVLAAHDFYGMSKETDIDSGATYLSVDHENGHSTSIQWDRKNDVFTCDEIDPSGAWKTYMTASHEEIIDNLAAQAEATD